MSKKMNVLIACGGTGGHLFPGIAVAETLQQRGHKVLLLISEKKVDARASEKYGLLDFVSVPAIAKPATLSPRMIPFLIKLWKSIRQCKKILKEHQCDAVLGMGGFTSLPPVYAGKQLKLATYVHDSNALPGKANRLTARWCRQVLLGLGEAASYFPSRKVVVTGTPVRHELRTPLRQDRSRTRFKLPSEGQTVLVMGGSQGAKHLNTLVVEAAKQLSQPAPDPQPKALDDQIAERKTKALQAARSMTSPTDAATHSGRQRSQSSNSRKTPNKINFLHITGNADFERVSELSKDIDNYKVVAFCDDMAAAYAACDLALCRAGASSMTELSFAGMPSILVPYPYAADDHQTVNAQVFEKAGAAILHQEADLDTATLVKDLSRITGDSSLRQTMAECAQSLAVRDAAGQISDVITASS